MNAQILKSRKDITVRPYFLSNRISTKSITTATRIAANPTVISAGEKGCAVLFRYGVVVFFGTTEDEEALFIKSKEEIFIEPRTAIIGDNVILGVTPKQDDNIQDNLISIKKMDIGYIQLIAEVLARSVVLDAYEQDISTTFDHIDPIASELQARGPKGKSAKKLMRHIGHTLSIQRKMIGQVEVEGKPDVLWERSDLEKLYHLIENEFEITERHTALKHKLELIHQTAETMLGILSERRTLHVEWYIVILIVIEIFITLGEKFAPHIM